MKYVALALCLVLLLPAWAEALTKTVTGLYYGYLRQDSPDNVFMGAGGAGVTEVYLSNRSGKYEYGEISLDSADLQAGTPLPANATVTNIVLEGYLYEAVAADGFSDISIAAYLRARPVTGYTTYNSWHYAVSYPDTFDTSWRAEGCQGTANPATWNRTDSLDGYDRNSVATSTIISSDGLYEAYVSWNVTADSARLTECRASGAVQFGHHLQITIVANDSAIFWTESHGAGYTWRYVITYTVPATDPPAGVRGNQTAVGYRGSNVGSTKRGKP